MLKVAQKISFFFFIRTISLLAIIFVAWVIYNHKFSIVDTSSINRDVSQFIELKGLDEYTLALLVTNEEFTTKKYNYVMDLPIGDTDVNLSLVAHYKYYIKLAELKHNVENGIVYIHAPNLNLSTPVAFEFSTVQESQNESLFGPDGKKLIEQLKKDVSEKLINKGQLHVGTVYDKAAKALADNFNAYFIASGNGHYYKSIVVIFSNEKNQSERQFNYNNSYCGKEQCSLELDLGKGRILTFR
jgi:hypothetical protein